MTARRLVSYRVSLAVIIPLFVIVTGALIAGVAYFTTRSNTRSLAGELFEQVTGQTADQTRAHVQLAAPPVDLLAQIFGEEKAIPSDDEIERRMLLVLRANPGFSRVAFSDTDGGFIGAHRHADGLQIIGNSHIVNGKTVLDEQQLDAAGAWVPYRHDDDSKYDPRTRPFYQRAVAAKKRVWTDPYVFYDTGVPGITCAEPVVAPDGSLRGVVSVDFDLNSLGQFVATLHPSEHARVFIYTDAGAMLAHPTVHVVAGEYKRGEGKLVTAEDIDDEAVRAYFRAGASGAFSFDGKHYFAATRAFEPDAGLHWRVGAIAPEKDFMGALERMTRDVLLISLAVVVLAVALALTFARRIARPLVYLAHEMDEVGKFELGGEDPPPSRYREIDMMNRALAHMREGLASFAVYVPRDLVRAVLASGERAELGGKTKHMTVFFSDLAGFTTLSETMQPAALVELLAGYFDEMSTVISSHKGTIDKFIGDAIMAFWNAPTDHPEHPVSACEAALAFQKKLAEMKRGDPKLAGLSARIGIATGEVVVGNIGSHHRMNYTVMGDTVNLASRLEGLGKAYGTQILVSETCKREAGDRVLMRVIDIVAVKGKSQGVRVYEPLAMTATADERAREIAKLSEQAFEAYLARRWDEAASAFARIGDAPAETLRKRGARFKDEPPPADWSGTYVMSEK